MNFFYKLKNCIAKGSFEAVFVENGWEFSETFDFGYSLKSGYVENVFFFAKKKNWWILTANSNASYIFIQHPKTFHMSFHTSLKEVFFDPSDLDPSNLDPCDLDPLNGDPEPDLWKGTP